MKRFKHGCQLVLLVVALVVSAGVMAAEVVVQHKQGTARFTSVPQRVITFDIASLDTLDALGVDVIGVPKDFIPDSLSRYKGSNYTNVGSLFEPDFEVLAALRPDLIIIGNRSAPAYRQLSRLAPTLDMTQGYDDFVGELRENVRKLASIFDKQALAEEKLAAIDVQLAETRALGEQAGTALLLLANGGRLSAYGKGSRVGWVHDDLGLQQADENLKQGPHGDPVSFEFLLKTNPDYLFVLDRDTAIQSGRSSAKALLENDLVKQTRAWQQGNIVYLDAVTWYIIVSGLNAMPAMIGEIRAALED